MESAAAQPPVHDALLYRGLEEFAAGTAAFVGEGLANGEAVLVSVPGERHEALRGALGGAADRVQFADMRELGSNPGRIIAAVMDWREANAGRRARFVGEPIWPGRGDREALEAVRHEALLNLAFAGMPSAILCPYDAERLDARVLADAERTHPTLRLANGSRRSTGYEDPLAVYAAADRPLPPPTGPVSAIEIGPQLRRVRRFLAATLGTELGGRRLDDLLIAATEAAANALLHGRAPRRLRVWRESGGVVCEITDGGGTLDDPLAGRRRPDVRAEGGRGLWIMHQLCDLMELRSGPGATTVRLHVRLD